MGDAEYRLVTDPSEGPKLFQIDVRVMSSGATAVLLTGIDCAERVVCHESVSFDLSEGEFVFKLGAGNGGAVLDQLLQQGALKISRVFDMGGGRPGPVCVLTPGGAPQPPFGAKSPAELPDDDAGASDGGFFGLQRGGGGSSGTPTNAGRPTNAGTPTNAGAGLLAMLQGGGGGGRSPFPLGAQSNADSPATNTPTPPRHMMPRTTRGSTGGGPRKGGANEGGPEDGLFDSGAGRRGSRGSGEQPSNGKPPRSPMGGVFGGAGGGGGSSALVGGGGGGADLLGMLNGGGGGDARAPSPGPGSKKSGKREKNKPAAGTRSPGPPTSEDLLAMLGGGGGGGKGGAGASPAPVGAVSAAELEARMTGAANTGSSGGPLFDLMGMLRAAPQFHADATAALKGADSSSIPGDTPAIDLSGADGGLGFDVDDDLGELLGGTPGSSAVKNEGDWPVSDGLTHREEEKRRKANDEDAELARRVADAVKAGTDRLFDAPVGKSAAFATGTSTKEPLPEDNVGRQLLKKQGWTPLTDPITGGVVEEAPVPIPGVIPGRAGLGTKKATDAAAAAATTPDADGIDDLVDRQSKLLAMMGLEKKDSVGSSIGKQRASSAASSKATSVSGNNAETDSFANDSDDESWAEDDKPVPSEEPESKERTEVEHAYSHADLKKLNVGCDAVPASVDMTMFEEADLRKVEQVKREAAEKKKKEKAEKEAAEKEKKEKANADKAAKESARERVAKSKSTDALDDAPALGGALGLGFLGINNSSSSLASQAESTKEGEKKDEGGTQAAKGMSVKDLAAALMAELRGLEDRVEVLGEEEGAMVALKLGAALEAVRQEPFKSI